jgi:hypothetical protein
MHPRRTKRLRQVVGVVVRIIMEARGWQKTGRKGSLGVRAAVSGSTGRPGTYHNTGGLAFWFLRAERYERKDGMPYRSVRQRRRTHDGVTKNAPTRRRKSSGKGGASNPSNGTTSAREDSGAFRKKGIQ